MVPVRSSAFQCFSQTGHEATTRPAGVPYASNTRPFGKTCPHAPPRAVILGAVIGGDELVALNTASDVYVVVGTVVVFIVAIVIATMAGRRWGRRAISQRLTSLGSRLGLDPPEDE